MSLRRLVAGLVDPLKTAAFKYNDMAQRHPMATGILTTALKTSAADLFAQKVGRRALHMAIAGVYEGWCPGPTPPPSPSPCTKVVERREEIDLRRHGMFCAFGLFYLGGFQVGGRDLFCPQSKTYTTTPASSFRLFAPWFLA